MDTIIIKSDSLFPEDKKIFSKENNEVPEDIANIIKESNKVKGFISPTISGKIVHIPINNYHMKHEAEIKLISTSQTDIKVKEGARMENAIEKIIDRLDQDIRDHKKEIRDRDLLMQQQNKEREERFEKYLKQINDDAKEREERFSKSVEEIKTIVSDGEKNRKSTTIAMWTLAVTTILGIAAMVITVVTTK